MPDVAALLGARESETVECKEAWSDDCLKALAAFANTRGGTLVVGVTDDGRVVGWQEAGKGLERIAGQIVSTLRVHPARNITVLSATNPPGRRPICQQVSDNTSVRTYYLSLCAQVDQARIPFATSP